MNVNVVSVKVGVVGDGDGVCVTHKNEQKISKNIKLNKLHRAMLKTRWILIWTKWMYGVKFSCCLCVSVCVAIRDAYIIKNRPHQFILYTVPMLFYVCFVTLTLAHEIHNLYSCIYSLTESDDVDDKRKPKIDANVYISCECHVIARRFCKCKTKNNRIKINKTRKCTLNTLFETLSGQK